jgi:hypothetical protein
MIKVQVVSNGDEEVVLLPPDALARLGVSPGDTVFARETRYGIELVSRDSELARQLEIAEGVLDDFDDALGKLGN